MMLIIIRMINLYVYCAFVARLGMCLTSTYFIKNDNKRVTAFTNTLQSPTVLACGYSCSGESDCWSVSFNDVTQECLQSDLKVKVIQDSWIEGVGWQTLAKTGKQFLCQYSPFFALSAGSQL